MNATSRIVLTLVVRDDADLVAATIEHHLAQGVDHVIATDLASKDGSREILAAYAELGVLTLHDEPRSERPVDEIRTRMAREAVLEHGADWVVPIDANEFWVPERADATLAETLRSTPTALGSFRAPVRDLLGRPAADGSVLCDHVQRDERAPGDRERVGRRARPADALVLSGDPEVVVSHGGRASSLAVADEVPEASRLAVYRYPLRAWPRFEERIRSSTDAEGAADRRRLDAGVLDLFFVARHPDVDGDGSTTTTGFVQDTRIADLLTGLGDRARLPERLAPALERAVPMDDEAGTRDRFERVGRALVVTELERESTVTGLQAAHDLAVSQRDQRDMEAQLLGQRAMTAEGEVDRLTAALARAEESIDSLSATIEDYQKYVANMQSNRAVAAALAVSKGRGARKTNKAVSGFADFVARSRR